MYFTFNWFPPQENRRERKTARAPIAHPSTNESSIRTSKHWRVAPQHQRDRRTQDRSTQNQSRSQPKAHRRRRSRHRSQPSIYFSFTRPLDLMIFFCWVLFLLCLSIEEWYYIFVWKLRKCEQQVKNVFSIVFSRIQPNTRKYFSKNFLKCNQTLKNIFIFQKYFHLKIFYTRKIFYTKTNAA